MADPLSCEQCAALLADYLLRALEPDMVGAVAEHLSTCPHCQAEHDAHADILDRLAQAVPQQEPPADLLARVLATAEGESLPATVVTPLLPSGHRRGWRGARMLLLTAANVVLCLGVGWWTWAVQQQTALVQQQWQAVQRQLAMQQQTFTLLTAPDARPVPLQSDHAESQARGILVLQPAAPNAALIVHGLPPLHQGRAYQLWLLWGDRQRDNGGVFSVDAQGFALLRITAPRPFMSYQRVGITEEPASGSPGPTSPRVIGGTLQGS